MAYRSAYWCLNVWVWVARGECVCSEKHCEWSLWMGKKYIGLISWKLSHYDNGQCERNLIFSACLSEKPLTLNSAHLLSFQSFKWTSSVRPFYILSSYCSQIVILWESSDLLFWIKVLCFWPLQQRFVFFLSRLLSDRLAEPHSEPVSDDAALSPWEVSAENLLLFGNNYFQ